jgi:hypothetical protein
VSGIWAGIVMIVGFALLCLVFAEVVLAATGKLH